MAGAREKPGRRTTRSSRVSDAILGLFIPAFLAALAAYQQVTNGEVDKYVLGALVVFGLGALGWRLDVLFEAWLNARARAEQQATQESDPVIPSSDSAGAGDVE